MGIIGRGRSGQEGCWMSVFRRFFVVRLCSVFFMALAVLAIAQAPSASARTINNCEIVDSPTADQRTNCPGADLYGADLIGANLGFANLSVADLILAQLHLADLHLADLSVADLNFANLTDADLGHADLSNADLTYADLSGADLRSADLVRADLTNADLSGADLRNADLTLAKFCRTIMPDGSELNSHCRSLGAKPAASRIRTFVLAAATTRTFDIGYPSALKYKRAKYSCDARASGPGQRYVKIVSHRSARGGTVCRVKARNNARLRSLDTTAKITVTATTIR